MTAGPAAGGGAAAGGARAGAGTPAARGGGGITFTHQRSSKRALAIDWDFPVYKASEPKPKDGQPVHTVSAVVEAALPREQAFAWLNRDGADRRPLLVLRECGVCKGTDDALLSRTLKNEDTQLLARFFHCVKLPMHVMQATHPFHSLFDREHPPHVFLASFDGSNAAELTGTYTQGELCKVMYATLEREYVKDAKAALKELVKLLAQYDNFDSMEDEIRDRMEKEIEKYGPKSAKLAGMKEDLAAIDGKRQSTRAREKALLDLQLRAKVATPEKPAKPETKDGKAGG